MVLGFLPIVGVWIGGVECWGVVFSPFVWETLDNCVVCGEFVEADRVSAYNEVGLVSYRWDGSLDF